MKSKKKLIGIVGITIILCAIVIGIVIASKTEPADKKLSEQLNLGNRYMDELNYEEAIAAYEEVLKIDPKNEEAYIGLANAYIAMGENAKAIEVLEEGYTQTGSAAIQSKKEEVEQILESIEETENVAPVTPTPLPETPVPATPVPTEAETDPYQEKIDLAKQYIENEQIEDAIAELEAAIELEPENETAYKELAQLYESMGDYESALEVLDKGIENTESEELINYRETIEQMLEELQETEEEVDNSEEEEVIEPVAEPTAEPTIEPTVQPVENPVTQSDDVVRTERSESYFGDGSYYIYGYNSKDQEIRVTYYNADGTIIWIEVHEYDELGRWIKTESTDGYWATATYTENSKIVNWSDGSSRIYEYDEYDRIVKQIDILSDGNMAWVEHIYDGLGNCTINIYGLGGIYKYSDNYTEEKGANLVYSQYWN